MLYENHDGQRSNFATGRAVTRSTPEPQPKGKRRMNHRDAKSTEKTDKAKPLCSSRLGHENQHEKKHKLRWARHVYRMSCHRIRPSSVGAAWFSFAARRFERKQIHPHQTHAI